MTEYVPTPEDDELEATIGRLFDRLEDAREGSAEYKMMFVSCGACATARSRD